MWFVDRFKVRRIGRGAAGAVYEGRWRGGAVAIKELELDGMRDADDPVQAEILLSFRHEVSCMGLYIYICLCICIYIYVYV